MTQIVEKFLLLFVNIAYLHKNSKFQISFMPNSIFTCILFQYNDEKSSNTDCENELHKYYYYISGLIESVFYLMCNVHCAS